MNTMNSHSNPLHWALPTTFIVAAVDVPESFMLYDSTLEPRCGLFSANIPNILHPTSINTPPPDPFTYPRAQTLNLAATDEYRSRLVYEFQYSRPIDPRSEVERLATVCAPPTASPRWDETAKAYILDPLEGMTALIPGIPVRVILDGKSQDSVTVATLFDLPSLQRYPEYPEIKKCSDKLWDITWGHDGGTPVYKIDGLVRNMRSAGLNSANPWDGSSSLASTKLEGNGEGDGRPATQANSVDAVSRRLLLVSTLSQLYWVMAPLAMSKKEFNVTTFRTCDMNVFSFGGLLPTGVTGLQQNVASAWRGGELATFIGLLQGGFHVDINDDPCRWTMVSIQIWIPPGSDPGAFILARWGLYSRTEVDASGQVRLFLWFKGNDLHSGIAPSVHPSVRQEFLTELAETFNKQDEVNRVVHVCYPTEALTHRTVEMAKFPPTSFDFPITVNPHYYADEGVPALGDDYELRCRLFWDTYMQNWNRGLQQGMIPTPLLSESLVKFQVPNETGGLQIKQYSFPPPRFYIDGEWKFINPVDDADIFASWRELWRRHEALSNRYLLKMSKYDYRFGQAKAMEAYEDSLASGVLVLSQIASATHPRQESSTVVPGVAQMSYPSIRKDPLKRRAGDDDHPSKRTRISTPPDMTDASLSPPHSAGLATSTLGLTVGSMDQTSHTEVRVSQRQLSVCDSTGEPELSADECEYSDGNPQEKEDEEDEKELPPEEVSFIVDSRTPVKTGTLEYKIRWSGYGNEEDCWIGESQLLEFPNLIEEYHGRVNYVAGETSHRRYEMLLRAFQVDLSEDIYLLETFNASLKRSVTASNPKDILRASNQLQDIAINLESSVHFCRTVAQSVVPSLTVAATIVKGGNKFSLEEKARTFGVNQAVGRAYLYVYNWFTDYGPTLCAALIHSFHAGLLTTLYPSFAPFVKLVMTSAQTSLRILASKRVAFSTLNLSDRQIIIPTEMVAGIIPQSQDPLVFSIPTLQYRLTTTVVFDDLMSKAILEFLSFHLILQPAARLPTEPFKQLSQADWIVRGAVVDAIVDTFDDDSILGLPIVHDVLKTPWSLIGKAKPLPAAREVLNDPRGCTTELRRWLAFQPRLPQAQHDVRRLARCSQDIIQKLTNLTVRTSKRTHTRQGRGIHISLGDLPVSPETPLQVLCPYEGRPLLGYISVMLRDVLAFARKQSFQLEPLRRILSCADLKTSSVSATKNPDHYTPIRQSAHFHRLYVSSLTSSSNNLTSIFGLSNILVRFATGQSYKTEDFMNQHLTRWFTSADDCVQVFEMVRDQNRGLPQRQHMPFTDGGCWGQYTWVLNLKDTKTVKRSIRERIEPLFSRRICELWTDYCGAYVGIDQASIPSGDLPSYDSVFELLDMASVSGFGPGSVTRMQVANFFALVGLCQEPSVEIMGRMAHQLKKGALKGLMVLGFDVRHADEARVIEAFKCVYDFLDFSLNAEDKKLLGFGALFVEHLLCKVIRWFNVLNKVNLNVVVMDILNHAQEGHDWRSEGFPAPLLIDRSKIQEWIEKQRHRI